jgi:hypothetical protein
MRRRHGRGAEVVGDAEGLAGAAVIRPDGGSVPEWRPALPVAVQDEVAQAGFEIAAPDALGHVGVALYTKPH